MKIATLLTTLALACGTAVAAGDYSTPAHDTKAAPAATTQAQPQGESFATKTKRAFHRLGDKLRGKGHKDTEQARSERDHDTRAMGAGPAGKDATDHSRRERMDSAYSNWQHKNQQK